MNVIFHSEQLLINKDVTTIFDLETPLGFGSEENKIDKIRIHILFCENSREPANRITWKSQYQENNEVSNFICDYDSQEIVNYYFNFYNFNASCYIKEPQILVHTSIGKQIKFICNITKLSESVYELNLNFITNEYIEVNK